MNFVLVGASLFASNIGSGHFIGLAGTGAASGIGTSGFELSAIFYLIFLGWCFIPVYMSSGVFTMPEDLRLRFGGQRIRVYLSVLALLLYVFTKISADLYAGALFITESTGFEGDGLIYISILILLAIATLFTVAGGLAAVIWTDFIQTVLMIIGAIVLSALAFTHEDIGGYESLIDKYFSAVATIRASKEPNGTELCGAVPGDAMHLLRSAAPGQSDLPWSGMVFGLAVSSIWYWCSDQVIVQRALASRDLTHAKGACILAGYLKLLPLFIMIFPGMAARVLFTDEVACADPEECLRICGSRSGCTNIAFVKLVTELMPVGARGMMLAVMLAALMSSLTSIFNSSSTIFTMDIYPRLRARPSEVELLLVGRLFVLVLVAISVVWIPIIQASQGSQLFNYIQSITSYLAPPICAVYLLAFISGLITVGVSLVTPPPPPASLHRLTYWSRHSVEVRAELAGDEDDMRSPDANTTKPLKSSLPKWRVALNWLCGVEMAEDGEEQGQEAGRAAAPARSLSQVAREAAQLLHEPEWKRGMVDANAVLVMSVAMFFWGFYA